MARPPVGMMAAGRYEVKPENVFSRRGFSLIDRSIKNNLTGIEG
jgi:hypothetical protein